MEIKPIRDLLDQYFVKIGYFFGSQKEAGINFLNGKLFHIDETADLDIGIVFKDLPQNPFEIYGEIYASLSTMFEPFNIDLVFLQETSVLFQYEAIIGELFYCADEDFLDDYEEMVMKRAADLSFKKIEFENDFLEAVKDGYFEITYR